MTIHGKLHLFPIFALFAAPVVAQAPAPQLTLEQQTSVRCSAAFAIIADGQDRKNKEALAYPPLGEKGREFFVRSSARLMDDAGLSREQVAQLISAEAQKLWDDGTIEQVMPSCLLLLNASGI